MAKPTDINQKRLELLIQEKQDAQDSFCELIKILQANLKSSELTEHFSLKCIEVMDVDSLLIFLDDFFIGLLKLDWHIHYPVSHVSNQWLQKISSYSKVKARQHISWAVVDKTYEINQITPCGVAWLLGKSETYQKFRILPFSELMDDGFLALGLDGTSHDLTSQCYAFISKALCLTLNRLNIASSM